MKVIIHIMNVIVIVIVYEISGYSFVMNSVQNRFDSVLDFCVDLAYVHGRQCDVNTYYTAANQQGFRTHFGR